MEEEQCIVRSPFTKMASEFLTPVMSLPSFLFQSLHKNYDLLKERDLLINVEKGTSIKFGDFERLSKQFASALYLKGFKKGDILYYVTYDTAYLYVVQMGVWLCGGAVRGCFQREDKREYERQMREVSCKFILIEKETAEAVKIAAERLEWDVQYLSVGEKIEGAIFVEDMMQNNDGTALPMDVHIDPKEDVIYIPTTSGTTGLPKGVLHTHYNLVSSLTSAGLPTDLKRDSRFGQICVLHLANFNVLSFLRFCYSFMVGETFINIPKFDQKTFLDYLNKCKPDSLHCFPYVTNWLINCQDIENYDLSSIKRIVTSGSILDTSSLSLLSAKFPQVRVYQAYGMTEILMAAAEDSWQCDKIKDPEGCEKSAGLKIHKLNNELHVSCGPPVPFAEVKIIDVESGKCLGREQKGRLLIRVPYLLKGYIRNSIENHFLELEEDGWFDTGDIAFCDNDGYLYIVDRLKSVFKYYSHHVYPSDIEKIINEHPGVSASAVVAVPNPETGSLARAYVVLKPSFSVSEEEIKNHVAGKAVFYKHLHGGVKFLDVLPESRGGKVDKKTLLKRAIEELKPTDT